MNDITSEERGVPRWIQIPVGLCLGTITLFCLVSSLMLFYETISKAPFLLSFISTVLVLGCGWALAKCIRLVTGRKTHGGLMSPRALRFLGWFFLLLPLGGFFTGYIKTHRFLSVFQAAVYISIFFGLRSLASQREKADAQPGAAPDAANAAPGER